MCKIIIAALVLLTVSMFTGCTKYEKYNPAPVGIYYPVQCISNVLGREATILMRPTTVTLCQPIEISEVGIIQYDVLDPNTKAEVARLEFSNGAVYVMADKLKAWGKIKYRGSKNVTISKFWSDTWSAVKVATANILVGIFLLGSSSPFFSIRIKCALDWALNACQ